MTLQPGVSRGQPDSGRAWKQPANNRAAVLGVCGLTALASSVAVFVVDWLGQGFLWGGQGWFALGAVVLAFLLLTVAARSSSGPSHVMWTALAILAGVAIAVGAIGVVIVFALVGFF
jgi:hypothetical protein